MSTAKSVEDTVDPASCESMTEVREGVDAIDRALVALMARRFGYMEAAARIKPSRETVRDEQRKADVIANVKAHAAELGVPVPLAAALWEMLVESSIAYEFVRYDEMRG
ncbi:chorismate mutase [Parasphingopyxis algicola]|uniref:chorismate mutase n=1 Tax=Parasphingopyxis algicola TaxID=2026624 RepID=UPI001FE8426B|nr:chorismate mutase [Parasphingopyxis algicola]